MKPSERINEIYKQNMEDEKKHRHPASAISCYVTAISEYLDEQVSLAEKEKS